MALNKAVLKVRLFTWILNLIPPMYNIDWDFIISDEGIGQGIEENPLNEA